MIECNITSIEKIYILHILENTNFDTSLHVKTIQTTLIDHGFPKYVKLVSTMGNNSERNFHDKALFKNKSTPVDSFI